MNEKNTPVATSRAEAVRRRTEPMPSATSTVNGIAIQTALRRGRAEEQAEGDAAEGGVGEAVAEEGEAALHDEHAEEPTAAPPARVPARSARRMKPWPSGSVRKSTSVLLAAGRASAWSCPRPVADRRRPAARRPALGERPAARGRRCARRAADRGQVVGHEDRGELVRCAMISASSSRNSARPARVDARGGLVEEQQLGIVDRARARNTRWVSPPESAASGLSSSALAADLREDGAARPRARLPARGAATRRERGHDQIGRAWPGSPRAKPLRCGR